MILTKASATGNDFILVDLLDGEASTRNRGFWVKQLCDRFEGIGADGVAFLEPAAGFDFGWDFYNSDGGRAEMCGNASRAVGLYVSQKTGRHDLKFKTLSGAVRVVVHSPARIEAHLAPLGEVRRGVDFTFVRAGVPHAVIPVPDARDWYALRKRAREIKARPEFTAEGVNVTFYAARGARVIDAVTFERGVEDFTRSCGTGAVAAAFACVGADAGAAPVQVRVPGGELSVICNQDQPVLVGPARLIARITWLD